MAQTTIGNIGGKESNAVYNFLNLPHSAKASALGGINISHIQPDLGLAMYNPALLTPTMDSWLHLSVKPYLADIKQYDFSGAKYIEQKNSARMGCAFYGLWCCCNDRYRGQSNG